MMMPPLVASILTSAFRRHLQLVRYRPVPVVVPVAAAAATPIPWTIRTNPAAGRGDLNLFGDVLSRALTVVPHRDARAHLHVGSIPSPNSDAPVAPGVEIHGAEVRKRLFAHLAEVRAAILTTPLVLRQTKTPVAVPISLSG